MKRLATALLLIGLHQHAIAPALADCSYAWRPGQNVPGVNGIVFRMTTWDPDGAGPMPAVLVAAGGFYAAGDVLARGIAYWDGASWHPFGSGTTGGINALTVYNGRLIAAGDFNTIGGTTAQHIAQWDGASWQPLGSGINGSVQSLTVFRGNLVAAGPFSLAGGTTVKGIAQWNGSAWQPLGSGLTTPAGADSYTYGLTVWKNTLIAAGSWTIAGGVNANYIAQWDGSFWSALGTGTNEEIDAIIVTPGDILIAAGMFTMAGGVSAKGIAQWNGTTWQPLGSGITFNPDSLTIYNGDLIAAGFFNQPGVTSSQRIARWDGSFWHRVDNGDKDTVIGLFALTTYNGALIAGTNFVTAGGLAGEDIAQWDGTKWGPLGSGGLNWPVATFAFYNGTLVAGGDFRATSQASLNSIGQWDGSAWQPLGAGFGGSVTALADYAGKLIAAGSFIKTGDVTVNYLAQWDGMSWSDLDGGLQTGSMVLALGAYKDRLIVGGHFVGTAKGVLLKNIAQWDGAAWTLINAMSDDVNALLVHDDKLIAGGKFVTIDADPVNHIAQWDGTSWKALALGLPDEVTALTDYNGMLTAAAGVSGGAATVYEWNGMTWTVLGNFNRAINALTVYKGLLFAGGAFSQAGGSGANNVAFFDGISWQPLAGGMDDTTYALIVQGDELVAGGSFVLANNQVSSRVARWGPLLPVIAQQPNDSTVVAGQPAMFSAVATGEGTLKHQWRHNGTALTNGDNISGATDATLMIAAARSPDDAGDYDDLITDDCATATTHEAKLTVNSPAGGGDGTGSNGGTGGTGGTADSGGTAAGPGSDTTTSPPANGCGATGAGGCGAGTLMMMPLGLLGVRRLRSRCGRS